MIRVGAVTRREDDGLLALLNCLAEGNRPHLLLPGPASRVPKDVTATRAGLSLLTGPPFILDLGTTLAGRVVLGGRTVLYVDGANAFDPYILSALAREVGQPPKAVMQRLYLTRAFTCHQLETLLVERLPSAIARYRPGLVVISGWSHLFHDENVPAREAFRLLQNTARRIRSLAEAGQPILATHPEEPVTPRLQPLREILTRAADGVARLREEEGLILVDREKPPDPRGARSLVISPEHCRPWIRGHHHQELPVAYCAVRKTGDSSLGTAQSGGRVRGGAAARPSR
jgi:hypothetical protein